MNQKKFTWYFALVAMLFALLLASQLLLASHARAAYEWRSTYHGVTWSKINSFPGTKCTFVAIDAQAGTVGGASRDIYVGTFDNLPNRLQGGIYKSSDGGASWSLIPGQPTQLKPKSYEPANAPLPPNALQAAIGGDYVYFALSNGPSPHGDYVIENNILNGAVYRYNGVEPFSTTISQKGI